MAIQESGEMYLETILVLSARSNFVRSVDVGEALGYSKPSVSRAMGLLKKEGYVTVGENGNLLLTDTGRSMAEKIYERHTVLTEALKSLGVDEKRAADDACRIEHVISDETMEAIKKHMCRSV